MIEGSLWKSKYIKDDHIEYILGMILFGKTFIRVIKIKAMKNNTPTEIVFEKLKRIDDLGNEYWNARDLSKTLEYSEYRHFLPVIARAKESCNNSGHNILDHFEDVLEMVTIGSGAKRELESIKLSRYASYLIVQNADPSKEIVAQGQTYFAVQTRIQEISQMDEYTSLTTEKESTGFRSYGKYRTIS